MICDIKASAERMRQKLVEIEGLTVNAQVDGSHTDWPAYKYRIFGQALAQIADIVQPNKDAK